jgi:hypothetical protein
MVLQLHVEIDLLAEFELIRQDSFFLGLFGPFELYVTHIGTFLAPLAPYVTFYNKVISSKTFCALN